MLFAPWICIRFIHIFTYIDRIIAICIPNQFILHQHFCCLLNLVKTRFRQFNLHIIHRTSDLSCKRSIHGVNQRLRFIFRWFSAQKCRHHAVIIFCSGSLFLTDSILRRPHYIIIILVCYNNILTILDRFLAFSRKKNCSQHPCSQNNHSHTKRNSPHRLFLIQRQHRIHGMMISNDLFIFLFKLTLNFFHLRLSPGANDHILFPCFTFTPYQCLWITFR